MIDCYYIRGGIDIQEEKEKIYYNQKNIIDEIHKDTGHSHKINDKLTVGGKVKLLFGLAYADIASKDNIHFQLTEDKCPALLLSTTSEAVVLGAASSVH